MKRKCSKVFVNTANMVMLTGCGYCPACVRKRILDWQVRCFLESFRWKYSYFLTLTFEDGYVEKRRKLQQEAVTRDVVSEIDYPTFKREIARLRYTHGNFKYFGVYHYGSGRGRPHVHLMFFTDKEIQTKKIKSGVYIARDFWSKGFCYVSKVRNIKACTYYIVDYITSDNYNKTAAFWGKDNKERLLYSKGLGFSEKILESVVALGSTLSIPTTWLKKLRDKYNSAAAAARLLEIRQRYQQKVNDQVYIAQRWYAIGSNKEYITYGVSQEPAPGGVTNLQQKLVDVVAHELVRKISKDKLKQMEDLGKKYLT